VPELLDRQILFIGGKGGVGKTTTASALGLLSAQQGQRCLLVSTDPAHSLGDIFTTRIGNREKQLTQGLWGLEIDPDTAADQHIKTVKDNMRSLVHPSLFSEIDRQMNLARLAPGTVESAMLERMCELMIKAPQRFDRIIFDTAPTGHTLRLLSLPEMIAAWTDSLLRQRQRSGQFGEILNRLKSNRKSGDSDDLSYFSSNRTNDNSRNGRIRDILERRSHTYRKARRILLNADQCAFIFVLTAEKLPILETGKSLKTLEQYKVPVQAMIINRILPATNDTNDEFLNRRRHQQAKYLADIDHNFRTLTRYRINLLDRDVYGVKTLQLIAGQLQETFQ